MGGLAVSLGRDSGLKVAVVRWRNVSEKALSLGVRGIIRNLSLEEIVEVWILLNLLGLHESISRRPRSIIIGLVSFLIKFPHCVLRLETVVTEI